MKVARLRQALIRNPDPTVSSADRYLQTLNELLDIDTRRVR
jgi:hypothetical protein